VEIKAGKTIIGRRKPIGRRAQCQRGIRFENAMLTPWMGRRREKPSLFKTKRTRTLRGERNLTERGDKGVKSGTLATHINGKKDRDG